uniref:Uncharacterized protein n=1 Tax=Strombidium inclinatum TaxID=197538 RepID=A0A7S3IUY2_9SPIT
MLERMNDNRLVSAQIYKIFSGSVVTGGVETQRRHRVIPAQLSVSKILHKQPLQICVSSKEAQLLNGELEKELVDFCNATCLLLLGPVSQLSKEVIVERHLPEVVFLAGSSPRDAHFHLFWPFYTLMLFLTIGAVIYC